MRDATSSGLRVPVGGSFRDPAGHVFVEDGAVYRQVNECGRADYDRLMTSGLCDALTADGLLIPHRDVDLPVPPPTGAYKIIKPRQLQMVSYPYEWSFSQLKDAALLTLDVQRRALSKGMSLKDASAFNIQFHDGRPIFIDTLSFEQRRPGAWTAYRQFCQHFYAPLALASFTNVGLTRLSSLFFDGVPLEVASRILPFSTRFRRGPLLHLHLHAFGERKLARQPPVPHVHRFGDMATVALIDSIEAAVARLTWRPESDWAKYYSQYVVSMPHAIAQKDEIVTRWVAAAHPAVVWDLGANTGRFSRLSSGRRIATVAFDRDAACVETMYLESKAAGDGYLLPLVMDLANPSAALGWAHQERLSLMQRGPADMVLALALVHHLALGNNLPLARIAAFLRGIARHLIVEFIPATDPQSAALIASHPSIAPGYSPQIFEEEFSRCFEIQERAELLESSRILYLMKAA